MTAPTRDPIERPLSTLATVISVLRPGTDLRFGSWPDHAGSGSTLVISDILLPSYGVPGRIAALHLAGNAIVIPLAAEFIVAVIETIGDAP